ncbi:MAG: hypothetical protein JW932_09990 [Deltaproteobacteria bacterium]|nr:hypothetical protein [Deltaproteobacteria bacterium]
MNIPMRDNGSGRKKPGRIKGSWLFLGIMLALYTIVFFFSRQKFLEAMSIDCKIILQMVIPLFIAFLIMLIINLYVGPKKIISLMGEKIGIRGVLLSSLAGIISMGPIYAWYPMLKGLREKGVHFFYLSNFLGNRAIKPFLLPVMISFFGWTYTIIFNGLVWISSIIVSLILSRFCR